VRIPSIRRSTGAIHLQTAPELAAQALREAIISGELKGGDRVLEQKWSLRLGVGQPTLREALLELEHQGLVYKRQQRGTYVAQMSPEAYRQILEVRIPLESIAIGIAATLMTTEQEKELAKLIDTMSGKDADADVKTFHDCDVLFHRTIWEISDNPYLAEVLETITFRLFVFSIVGRWNDNPSSASERAAAVKQHQNMMAGLRTRDAKRARQMFVKSTVKYWNTQYKLKLKLEDLLPDG
jgi:DNA-binding GntR family transcriptional regulator